MVYPHILIGWKVVSFLFLNDELKASFQDGCKKIIDHLTALNYTPDQPQGPQEICDAISKAITDSVANIQSNAKIKYTYHTHIGNSSSGGGCYSKYVAGTVAYSRGAYLSSWIGAGHYAYSCNSCRQIISNAHLPGSNNGIGEIDVNNLSNVIHNNCPNPQYPAISSHYELNCGKTTSTIEKAEIIFN